MSTDKDNIISIKEAQLIKDDISLEDSIALDVEAGLLGNTALASIDLIEEDGYKLEIEHTDKGPIGRIPESQQKRRNEPKYTDYLVVSDEEAMEIL